MYVGDFKNELIHGRGAYYFVHPESRRTVVYEADWMYGIRVGGVPQLPPAEHHESPQPARGTLQREEVANTTHSSDKNDDCKLPQASCPTETALSEQNQNDKRGCRVLCLTAPPIERIYDAFGGPSQVEQRQVFKCFDGRFPRDTAASVATLLPALKEVLPAYWSERLCTEEERQQQRQFELFYSQMLPLPASAEDNTQRAQCPADSAPS